jgi:DUF4097 and DUF4098 domain-containing protein YvlB
MNATIKNIVLGSALSCTFAFSAYADITDTIERSFDVNTNSKFSLNNTNGEVEITSWSDRVIKVEATINADSQDAMDRVEVNMQQNGQTVSVETDYEDKLAWGRKGAAKVTYRVWLPMETELSEIELVNGSLRIDNVSGEIKAQVVNGSIKATGLTKNSEISSVNGSIKVHYQSVSSALNDINIETVNGSIKLYLPSDINAKLDLDTMHGSIKTEFGISSQENTFTGHNLRGEIGAGNINVSMESVNGSIKVLKN